MLSYDDYATLAQILGLSDALWEPRRGSARHSGDALMGIRSRAATDQLRCAYRDQGVAFMGPDRTALGRQAMAAQLARLNKRELVEVRARSGRAAHVRLTESGDDMARRACGLPTRASGAGFLQRLVRQLKQPRYRRWRWEGMLHETAMVYPHGMAAKTKPRPSGVGEMLAFLAPWLLFGHIVPHETTQADAWLELTDLGRQYYDALDPDTIEADWIQAWDREAEQTVTEYGISSEQQHELNTIFQGVFVQRRAELLKATPANLGELGEIALPPSR